MENLVGGEEGRGFQQVVSGLEIGRINIAARAVGVAQEAYDQALAYSKHQGGVRQEDLRIPGHPTEAGRDGHPTSRRRACWCGGPPRRPDRGKRVDIETAMAKYFASEVACRAALDSMRIHGGMGYSPELDIERL